MASSIFGPRDIGSWVLLKLAGAHELSAQVVNVSVAEVEVRERGCDDTWHIPTKSVVAWKRLACTGDQAGVPA